MSRVDSFFNATERRGTIGSSSSANNGSARGNHLMRRRHRSGAPLHIIHASPHERRGRAAAMQRAALLQRAGRGHKTLRGTSHTPNADTTHQGGGGIAGDARDKNAGMKRHTVAALCI